ncbi:apolipoprotein M [Rhincodon typus]|uniref:apolipoprotein M n=1 Tax=Rhincodon typus TaxID=259920 RepID=UPI00202E3ACC|nr:apolipoprotein M [Rhincodon typus]
MPKAFFTILPTCDSIFKVLCCIFFFHLGIQYSGKWYFIMMAADSDASLIKFRHMDSNVFQLTPVEDQQKLLLRGEIRLSQSMKCLSRQWIYHINNKTQEMILEGRPYLKTEIFVKEGDDYIVLLESQDKGSEHFRRLMLYGRFPTLSDFARLKFEHRANCLNLTAILVLEQAQEPCEIS